jgi:hypothetical protein
MLVRLLGTLLTPRTWLSLRDPEHRRLFDAYLRSAWGVVIAKGRVIHSRAIVRYWRLRLAALNWWLMVED